MNMRMNINRRLSILLCLILILLSMGTMAKDKVLPIQNTESSKNEIEEKQIPVQKRGGIGDDFSKEVPIAPPEEASADEDWSFTTGFVESLLLIFFSEFGDRAKN